MCLALDAGVENATKPPICLNNEVIALLVPTYLGTGWALSDQLRANLTQSNRGQALSSVWDGWDGISQLHSYSGAAYTPFYFTSTELRNAVPRPNRFTILDPTSGFHAVKVTFM